MEKIPLSHHLVRVMKIKKKNYADWQLLLTRIKNLEETFEKTSRDYGFIQLIKEFWPYIDNKKISFIKHRFKKSRERDLRNNNPQT